MNRNRSSAKRGGGSGGRNAPPAETVSVQWTAFVDAHVALCQLILDELGEKSSQLSAARAEHEEEDEDDQEADLRASELDQMIEGISEQIDALASVRKKKLPFNDRMELTGVVNSIYGDALSMILIDMDHERDDEAKIVEVTDETEQEEEMPKAKGPARGIELQAQAVYNACVVSTLTYMADCVARAGGANASSNKLQKDSEMEGVMSMQLLDTLFSCSSSSPYAHDAIAACLPQLSKLLLGITTQAHRSAQARQAALSVLASLIESDSSLFELTPQGPNAVMQQILDACSSLCSELSMSADVTSDDNHDAEENNNHSFGTALLEVVLSNVVPTASIAQLLLQRAQTVAQNKDAAGQEKNFKAALVCITLLPSSAPTFVAENTTALWSVIETGLKSASPYVRAAALVAGGELVQRSANASQAHATALSSYAFAALDQADAPLFLQLRACVALTSIFSLDVEHEHDGEREHEHGVECNHQHTAATKASVPSSEVLPRLLAKLQSWSGAPLSEEQGQLGAGLITVIESIIEHDEGCGEWKQVLETLLPLVALELELPEGNDELEEAVSTPIRAGLTSLLAAVLESSDDATACAVAAEFGAALAPLLMQNLRLQDSELRASTHKALAVLSSDAAFAAARLPSLLPSLLATVTRVFSEEYTPGGAPIDEEAQSDAGGEEEDEEEEDMDEDRMEREEEREEAVSDERMSALLLYRSLLESVGQRLLEVDAHEAMWSCLTARSLDLPALVQEEICATLPVYFTALYSPAGSSSSSPKFTPGVDLELSSQLKSKLKQAAELLLSLLKYSTEPTITVRVFESLAQLLQVYGQVVLSQTDGGIDKFVTLANKALHSKLISQQGFKSALPEQLRRQIEAASAEGDADDDEVVDEEGEDAEDNDNGDVEDEEDEGEMNEEEAEEVSSNIVRSLSDCLSSLSKAQGDGFAKTFARLQAPLLSACKNDKSAFVVGTLAEMGATLSLQSSPEWATPIIANIEESLNAAIEAKDHDLQRNLIYALGSFIFHGQDAFSSHRVSLFNFCQLIIRQANERLPSLQGKDNEAERHDLLGARDNAASSFARAALLVDDHTILAPYMDSFLSALPIVEDVKEQSLPYSLLVKLVTKKSLLLQEGDNKSKIGAVFNTLLQAPIQNGQSSDKLPEKHADAELPVTLTLHNHVKEALATLT